MPSNSIYAKFFPEKILDQARLPLLSNFIRRPPAAVLVGALPAIIIDLSDSSAIDMGVSAEEVDIFVYTLDHFSLPSWSILKTITLPKPLKCFV